MKSEKLRACRGTVCGNTSKEMTPLCQKISEELRVKSEEYKFGEFGGITLISLVITIIILIILAGVVVNLSLGENGILKKAKKAEENYKEAEVKEKLVIAIADLQAEKLGEATLKDITKEWIDNEIKGYESEINENIQTNSKIITIKNGSTLGRFIIDEKLNIIENTGKIVWYYNIVEKEGKNIKISISIFDDRGIKKIEFPDQESLTYNKQKEINGIEYTVENGKEHKIKVTTVEDIEEITIFMNEKYKIVKNLPPELIINNEVEEVLGGSTYEALITSSNPSEYFLKTLSVKMNGSQVNVDEGSGKIDIASVTGDIEITATGGIGNCIIKSGILMNKNYNIHNSNGGQSYLEQKDGFVECKLVDDGLAKGPGLNWYIDANDKNYSYLLCKLSNPQADYGAPGGKIFVGSTLGTEYAAGNYGEVILGDNDYPTFTNAKEYKITIKGKPKKFYVGIQNWWRSSGRPWRIFRIYDFILVE